ncbi:hypothetical protein GUJ93_ZPchr0001g30720 [Zizania palustris]|uniref:Wall-associated receptor kinase C-terminal domain-containing protein n=1 Tax=Zizania palustris TaxID=103762 RepID=A0A8J5V811_ZIZPA|nr:hypothetical protein GUJ93_ZPchr0001g30720 [Zizania palustris]
MRPTLLLLPLWAVLLFLGDAVRADCERKPCGDLTVEYPFWLGGPNIDQSSSSWSGRTSCGHPAFEVWCRDDGVASLGGSQILVLRIDHSNSSMVASHKRIADGNDGVCKADFNVSSSIALSPFKISSSNRVIFLLYNCINSTVPPSEIDWVNATTSGCIKPIFAHLGGSYDRENPQQIPTGSCTYSYQPVLGTAAPATLTATTNYSRLFREGFLLEWQENGFGDCAACNASGGQCRYNNDTASFACLCSDGKLRRSTCSGEYHLPS